MGTLQKFISFTETLNAADKAEAEKAMLLVMQRYADNYALTPGQTARNAERLADTNPEMASQADIDAVFGKSLPS